MHRHDDFKEEEEGFFLKLFEAIREAMPVVSEDFTRGVRRQVSLLSDDPRLEPPAIDDMAGGFLGESLTLVMRWLRAMLGQEDEGDE
jgi:hypothetical protein